MLQKLALAVKTKTIEFFAEEDDEDDLNSIPELCLDSNEEIITGQRVVVIKPDKPSKPINQLPIPPSPSSSPYQNQSHHLFHQSLASSLFATVSAFHAAYLQLQTAQDPFDPCAIEAADRAAVSQLRSLSELKKAYCNRPKSLNWAALHSEIEAKVLENQSLLRKYETAFNRLQSDVDCKDGEVSVLREELKGIEGGNALLKRKVENCGGCHAKRERMLKVGFFNSVFNECCRLVRRFAKAFIDLMKDSGWDLQLAANSMYPDVGYAKKGHCKYAILSYVCLIMFDGFGSDGFGDVHGQIEVDEAGKLDSSRKSFVGELARILTIDDLERLDKEQDHEFTMFCEKKYGQLIHSKMRESLAGELDWRDCGGGLSDCSNLLYEPFVLMSNAVWMLRKLALAFDHPVEIFRVAHGADFSIVYMDNVLQGSSSTGSGGLVKRSVGFTVVPGFYIGSMVIQCKVYLDFT